MSLYKISIRALLARSIQEVSWQDLNRCLCNVSVQDLLKKRSHGNLSVQTPSDRSLGRSLHKFSLSRSLRKISIRGLLARSLEDCTSSLKEISWQDLCKRPLGKISVQGVYESRLYKLSTRYLLPRSSRSWHKLSIKDLLVKTSTQDLLD